MDIHRRNATATSLAVYVMSHALWCTCMMLLHRGSLAYSDLSATDISENAYRGIGHSISICQVSAEVAITVLEFMRETCHQKVMPFMGHSAYITATTLMTSPFSKDTVS